MIIRLLLGLILLPALCASQLSAASMADLPLKTGTTIFKARPALMRQGWQPVETFTPGHIAEFAHSDGDSFPIYRHGFKEVERCTGVDDNTCFFNYRKGNQCLMVGTSGEFDAGKSPKVDNWQLYPAPRMDTRGNKRPVSCSEDASNKFPLSWAH